jgi:glycosyltransferase involved in cell wall biosynthesis
LKIVINTRLLIKDRLEGIGRFSYETLKRLVKLRPQDEFVFLFDRPFSKEFIFNDKVKAVVAGPKARHPLLYVYWFNSIVPKVLKQEKADLFISMDGMLSLNTEVKQIPVIHDLNFIHHPEFTPFVTQKYYNYYFPKFAYIAARIITVSEFSKQDIVNHYNISESQIDVSNNAASDVFNPISSKEKDLIKEQYSSGCNYFIYLGSINPRKNVLGVLKAFELLKIEEVSDLKLIISGDTMWGNDSIVKELEKMSCKKDVVFTGRVGDKELTKILASSIGLCYVSFFEGFGIPILEAMKCGVPVITSNLNAMKEVSGNAALLVDPYKTESIKSAMFKVIKDDVLKKQLIENGFKQEQKYTWDMAAVAMSNSIDKCI